MKLITFGAGNMAQALIIPMAKAQKDLEVLAYTPSQTRARELAKIIDGKVLEGLENIPKADFYFLSCKPQQIEDLAQKLKGKLDSQAIVVSILAGTTMKKLSQLLDHHKIIRVMPNTPSLVGEGVSLISSMGLEVSEVHRVKQILNFAGSVFKMESEDQLDRVTGYTGSGPAYIFEWARIFISDLVKKGISEEEAKKMIVDLFYGASKMMKESEVSPEQLRINVTSKKGVTHEALEVFKANDLEEITIKALEAAYQRSKELSQ